MNAPKVSVIVPARGEVSTLRGCVESLVSCEYPDKEIIIVDDGLSPDTLESLQDLRPQFTLVSSGQRGASQARNAGVASSTGEYLAFTDSDCVVDTRWLKALMDGFERKPEASAVGGIQEAAQEATRFEKDVLTFMRKVGFVADYARCPADNAGVTEVEHNASCNVMYKRGAFLQAGGFRQGLWPGEDVDLDYRLRQAHGTLWCTCAAVVYHDKPRTPARFRKMMYSYGRAQGELVRLHAKVFRKIQTLPVITLVLCAIVFTRPMFGILLCALLAATAVFKLRSRSLCMLALQAFVCWHAGFCIGFIRGMLPVQQERAP